MRFSIKLDAINRGQEPAVLQGIKVVKFNTNNKLLADSPSKTETLLISSGGVSYISYPFTIGGSERLPDIEYRITVDLLEEDPIGFARGLNEFKDYEIELEYSFEDMARTLKSDRISITGSFKEYREQRIKEWSNNESQYKLAIEALKALGRI